MSRRKLEEIAREQGYEVEPSLKEVEAFQKKLRKIEKIHGGLLLVIKGHAPSGEKPEVLWYGFSEEAAKKQAVANSAYVYQLIWSGRSIEPVAIDADGVRI